MKKIKFVAGIVAAIALAGPSAFAQDQDASQPAPATAAQAKSAKKPKVWTDDNIDSVRKPSDLYEEQEAQKAAADQAAKEKADALAKLPSPPAGFIKPTTAEQVKQLLTKAQSDLKDQQDYVQQTQKELATATDPSDKERLQWRIKSRTEIISRMQDNIAALEKDRATLEKTSADSSEAPSR